jgi:Protein of unknown function (DUF3261)
VYIPSEENVGAAHTRKGPWPFDPIRFSYCDGFVRRLIALMFCLGVAACAAPPPMEKPVTIAPGITLSLPAPEDLGRRVDVVQMVTARHGADSFAFEGRLSVDGNRLQLVGSDAMGRRAMTVTWNGGLLEVERAAWLPESLHPENILADIVLLYWPEAVLRRSLNGADLRPTATGRTVGDVITVSWQGDPWTGIARLHNKAWDYDLEIRSAPVMP